MIESGRPCVDLAQHLHAVEAAVGNAKRELINDDIEHCLEAPADSSAATADNLRDLKLLRKYL